MRCSPLLLLALLDTSLALAFDKRSNSTSCAAGTQVVNGRTCAITCSTSGCNKDYSKKQVTCFQNCIDGCAADSRCVRAEYHEDTGYCHFKDTAGNPKGNFTVHAVNCDKAYGNTDNSTTSTSSSHPSATSGTYSTFRSSYLPTTKKATYSTTSAAPTGPPAGCNVGGSSTKDAFTFTPGSTLLPAVHWDYPVNDIRNLAPIDSAELYYSENGVSDPGVEHLFAQLSTTFNYKAVVLDHSIFVSSVSCSPNGILIKFNSQEGFAFAKSTWSPEEDFVLVTYTNGCGASEDQRTFWLIDSLQYIDGTRSILAKVKSELAIEDVFDGVEIIWGTYHPPTSNSASDGFYATSSYIEQGSSYTTYSPGSGPATSNGGSYPTYGTSSGAGSSTTPGSSPTGGSYPTGEPSYGTPTSTNPTSSDDHSGGGAESTNGAACGAAPAANIDGFPAADCGDADFDLKLDNALGYFDFDDDFAASAQDFFAGVALEADDLSGDSEIFDKRNLAKRWTIKGLFTAAVDTFVEVSKQAVKQTVKLAEKIPVVGSVVNFINEWNPKLEKSKDIDLGPKNDDTSPWGPAAQIYKKESTQPGRTQADIALYCVNCGLKGTVTVAGQGKFKLSEGIKELKVGLNANLEAGLHLGLVASATFKDKKERRLIGQDIPGLGLSVPKVFAAGVFVGVDAVGEVEVTAQGQALVGVSMSIPDFKANLDLLNGDNSKVEGFTPIFKREFKASGTIAASARLSLPVSLNVGIQIDVLNNWKKTISLIEEPSLYGKIIFAASTPNTDPASETCNNGFEVFANAQNDIKFNLFGEKIYTLNHYDSPPIISTCYRLSGTTTTTTVSATTTDDATTTLDAETSSTDDASTTDKATSTTEESGATESSSEEPSTTEDSTPEPTSSDDASPTTSSEDEPTDLPTRRARALWPRQTGESGSTDEGETSDGGSNEEDGTPGEEFTIVDEDDTDFTSNPNDNTENESEDVDDFDDEPNGDEFQDLSNEAQEAADAAEIDASLFNYTTIIEKNNVFALAPGENGNLYAAPLSDGSDNSGLLWATQDGIVIADGGTRLLYYYPEVMAMYKVSRLRLGFFDDIPKTTDVIGLAQLDDDPDDTSNPPVYFAINTAGKPFELVICNFSNGADSKIFIVDGLDGFNNLTQEKLRYTVTGGQVSGCDFVQLLPGTIK